MKRKRVNGWTMHHIRNTATVGQVLYYCRWYTKVKGTGSCNPLVKLVNLPVKHGLTNFAKWLHSSEV